MLDWNGSQEINVKFLDITSKGIRENLRDRRGFIFLLGLPVLLIVLFAFAFGSGTFLSGGSIPHEVVIINNDVGLKYTTNNTTKYVNNGTDFTRALGRATAENSTTHLFQLNNVSQEKANDLLKSRSIDALIIIPKDFSRVFDTMVNISTRAAITSSVGQQTIANSANTTPVFNPQLGIFVTPALQSAWPTPR